MRPKFSGVWLEVGSAEVVAACRDFYRDVIGLAVRDEREGESVWFEGLLGFHVGEPPDRHADAINLWFELGHGDGDGGDIDVEAARLQGAGVSLAMGPTDMPWGFRVVTMRDPAGHAVWVGSRVNENEQST